MNILGGNFFVGSDYKSMEQIFLDPKQMSKVNDQLTAYRNNGQIKTDEDLQFAREQVGLVASAAAEVNNATKTMGGKVSSVQKKKLFELTAERLSIEKEVQSVSIKSLVAEKQDRIAAIDNSIKDIISGKVTDVDIINEIKTPEERVKDEIANLKDDDEQTFTVSTLEEIPEEFRDRAEKSTAGETKTRKSFLGIPYGKETVSTNETWSYKVTGKEVKDYVNSKTETVAEITTEAAPSKKASKKNSDIDALFKEDLTDTSEKISDNLARNKSTQFEISKDAQKIVDMATKAAMSIAKSKCASPIPSSNDNKLAVKFIVLVGF